MIKKTIIATSVVVLLSGCMAEMSQIAGQSGGLGSLGGLASGLTGSSSTPTTGVATRSAITETAQQSKVGCIPRSGGGSTSFTQMVTEKVVEFAINSALEEMVGNADIKVPKRINDTCEADAVLAYITKQSAQFQSDIRQADKDILASLEQTKEIQHLRAQMEHKEAEAEGAEASVIIGGDDESKKLIENATIKDKEMYSKAMGKLAIATPVSGYVLIGWDKEILEFAKDNMPWGIENVMALKDVASQVGTTLEVLPALGSLVTSPLYDGRVDKSVAEEAAQEEIKSNEEAAAEAEGQW